MTDKDIVSKSTIATDLATRIIDAATAKAESLGKGFAIAIVDESGLLKAFRRMDSAPLISIQIAQDKAYTAVGFGIPSHGWYDFIKDDAPLALGAPTGIDRLVVFGGGYPIVVGEALVGAIGVSGGHYSEDMLVAEAGLEALSPLTASSCRRRSGTADVMDRPAQCSLPAGAPPCSVQNSGSGTIETMSAQFPRSRAEHTRHTREVYDRLAPVWAKVGDHGPFNGWLERPALRTLIPLPLTGQTILDAGCDSGAQVHWLLDHGAEVIRFDLSPAMVEETKRRRSDRGRLFVADFAEPLPLGPRSIDGITRSLSLHYLKDRTVPLKSFADALRPDGWVVSAVMDAFADHGFAIERIVEAQPSAEALHRFPQHLTQVVGVPWFIVYLLRLRNAVDPPVPRA